MKRLTVLLIAAVLVLGMSACGRSEQKEDTANVQNTEGEAENVTVSASPEEIFPAGKSGYTARRIQADNRCGKQFCSQRFWAV